MGSPSDYGEIFLILTKKGVVNDEQADKLIRMAGFRNVVIHGYRDILIEKVYDILQNRLSDFYEFVEAILDYLEKINMSI